MIASDKLELINTNNAHSLNDNVSLRSLAISMKRIADRLDLIDVNIDEIKLTSFVGDKDE